MILSIIGLSIALIITTALYLRERHRFNQPLKDYDLKSASLAQEKSYGLLHQAMKKAQTIMTSAELESLKAVSDSRYEAKKMEAEYQRRYEEALTKMENNFSAQVTESEKQFIQYLADLRVRSDQAQALMTQTSEQKTGELFDKFEQNLSSFLMETQQHSTSAIELELKAARQLIDTYKAQQLALIDESIVAMLEKTLSLVLTQKLSLKDNMDLIYEALEKAKAEKMIV